MNSHEKNGVTRHARCRIDARTSLWGKKVNEIVNSPAAVIIGQEKGSNRIHKLFWSIRDNDWFIAVQDWDNGDIITILNKSMACWAISHDTFEEARNLALGKVRPRKGDRSVVDRVFPQKEEGEPEEKKEKMFYILRFTADLENKKGKKLFAKKLKLGYHATPKTCYPSKIIKDQAIIRAIKVWLDEYAKLGFLCQKLYLRTNSKSRRAIVWSRPKSTTAEGDRDAK